MKKTKFIFAFAVIVFTLSIFTFAKSYTIESASFHVMLNEDGSADITENWVVNYKKGEFSRFYKTIYQGDEDGEKCLGHTTKYVKIDGVECSYTNDTKGRPDYHYSLVEDGDYLEYSAYLKSENVTRVYQFAYRREGVVKNVNDEYYYFKHRFLSDGFKKNVENISVRIEVYDKENSTIRKYSADEPDEDDMLYFVDSDVSDLYAVAVKIEGDVFSNLPEECYLEEDPGDGENGNMFRYMLLGGFFIIMLVLSCWISDKKKKSGGSGSSCSSCSSCSGCGGCGGAD